MKILFVGRAKMTGKVSPILYEQGSSLIREGCNVEYFALQGKGFLGYIQNIPTLRKTIKKYQPDIIHAHFSLTGFIVSLITNRPVIVSLMGSFPKKTWKYYLIHLYMTIFWKATIVKSDNTAHQLNRKDLIVIPNGVDLNKFSVHNKSDIRKSLRLADNKKYVLFAANPSRTVKNFSLAKQAVELLNDASIVLLPVFNVSHDIIVSYMAAVDLLLLTSLSEGSPNVVKEAMASNIPIVTTDVGNVRELLNDLEGTFICNTYNVSEIAELILKALSFNEINGREKIKQLNLDSRSVAMKLLAVYKKVMND